MQLFRPNLQCSPKLNKVDRCIKLANLTIRNLVVHAHVDTVISVVLEVNSDRPIQFSAVHLCL